eukprot:3664371-Pleurochrysis_carterae.AAC.1
MRGSYDRSNAAKRRAFAFYAYEHWEKVTNFTLGRACEDDCPYNRDCGLLLTPKNLLRAHEYSF